MFSLPKQWETAPHVWHALLMFMKNKVCYVSELHCCWSMLFFCVTCGAQFFTPLFLASSCPYRAQHQRAASGSSWVATSFSFPVLLCSHWAAPRSVRAERTPGSPPEALASRSPLLPARLREPSEWSAIVLSVIRWPRSTCTQSPQPHSTFLLVLRPFLCKNSSKIKLCKYWQIHVHQMGQRNQSNKALEMWLNTDIKKSPHWYFSEESAILTNIFTILNASLQILSNPSLNNNKKSLHIFYTFHYTFYLHFIIITFNLIPTTCPLRSESFLDSFTFINSGSFLCLHLRPPSSCGPPLHCPWR